MNRARGWKDVAKRARDDFREDHSALAAAGVAYFGFLSLVPGLAALVSVYGLVATRHQVQSRVQTMFAVLPTDARRLLETQLTRIVDKPRGSLGIDIAISVVLALWSASTGLAHLLEAINIAYDEQESRSFLKRRAVAMAFTLGGFVILGGIVTALALVPHLAARGVLRTLLTIGVWFGVAAVAFAALAVLYRFGPDRNEPRWQLATAGSLVTLGAWVVVSVGLQIYVDHFGNFDATYGSLAAVVLLLIWLYLTALLVIAGAQIDSEVGVSPERAE